MLEGLLTSIGTLIGLVFLILIIKEFFAMFSGGSGSSGSDASVDGFKNMRDALGLNPEKLERKKIEKIEREKRAEEKIFKERDDIMRKGGKALEIIKNSLDKLIEYAKKPGLYATEELASIDGIARLAEEQVGKLTDDLQDIANKNGELVQQGRKTKIEVLRFPHIDTVLKGELDFCEKQKKDLEEEFGVNVTGSAMYASWEKSENSYAQAKEKLEILEGLVKPLREHFLEIDDIDAGREIEEASDVLRNKIPLLKSTMPRFHELMNRIRRGIGDAAGKMKDSTVQKIDTQNLLVEIKKELDALEQSMKRTDELDNAYRLLISNLASAGLEEKIDHSKDTLVQLYADLADTMPAAVFPPGPVADRWNNWPDLMRNNTLVVLTTNTAKTEFHNEKTTLGI